MLGSYLSKKTIESGKIDPKRLVNPGTSIVTRAILRSLGYRAFDDKLERDIFGAGSAVRETLTAHGNEHGVVRSLRTTGATMLAESINSDSCRAITKKEVVERLSHVNGTMLETIYGRVRPPGMGGENIDEYLGLPDVGIGGEMAGHFVAT